MSPKISSLDTVVEKVTELALISDNGFIDWLLERFCDEIEFWDNKALLAVVVSCVDSDDVLLDVLVVVVVGAAEDVATDGGKRVVNEELLDDLLAALSSLRSSLGLRPVSGPALDCIDLLLPEEALLLIAEVLNTELQLSWVKRSEASSEPQKALLGDCDSCVSDWVNGDEQLNSIDGSLS